MNRRSFIKGSLAGALGLGLSQLTGLAGAQAIRPEIDLRARNVIFYCYDGFTWEDYGAARAYAARHQGRTLALERLFALGAAGSMMSHSLTSIVTDSAAASSAWSTGRKVVNGALSTFPDGRELTTIMALAKQAGKATGVATTTTATHATPAGFVVSVPGRGAEQDIADLYYDFGLEVILGGGNRFFDPEARNDGRDLYADFAARGYDVVRTKEALAASNGSKLLGIFAQGHVPYEIDRVFQGVDTPSLADMTRQALRVLSGYGNGFVLQIEAGRIDHSNHATDAATTLWDTLAADAALEVVLSFIDNHPDTLLILASDHGTGGGAVYGLGSGYRNSSFQFDNIAKQKASFQYMFAQLGNEPSAEAIAAAAQEHLGLSLSPEEAERLAAVAAGGQDEIRGPTFSFGAVNVLAYILANHQEGINLFWNSSHHTAGPVPVALYGANSRPAQIGLVDNVHLFYWMTEAIGVEYENPTMTEEEALRILETSTMPDTPVA
jgi:alkaline phosphatase